ncbi:MAG: hypothetical protein CMP22_05065 [Rickettsiales bacterium]|nr:hypothetical protein [Rickettsiales bacterium]|tara:strand:+ start:16 stop:396 length:381 start_codon:yes stop_codon:yes gene_type:complete
MDITPLIPRSSQVIQAYGETGVKVSGQDYEGSVLVFTDEVKNWDVQKQANELKRADFQFLEELKDTPEVLIVGTGTSMQFLAKDVRNYLEGLGIHPEMMDTGAAARTYNVLLSEGRSVCAALLPYA